ncbi:MAG: FHA domain-containing protein [Actinomycetales bacterium]|nr:FHA domain-containing protein [Actinomycetales bacterium]
MRVQLLGRVVVVLDDGRHLPGEATTLLGRAPEARPGEHVDALLTVPDPAVSKTHLGMRVAGAFAWITDRASTNGTTLVGPDGRERKLEAWVETTVTVGSEVRFGGSTLRVLLPEDSSQGA